MFFKKILFGLLKKLKEFTGSMVNKMQWTAVQVNKCDILGACTGTSRGGGPGFKVQDLKITLFCHQ